MIISPTNSNRRSDFLYPLDSSSEYRNHVIFLRKYHRRKYPRKQTDRPPPPDSKLNKEKTVSFFKTAISIAILCFNAIFSKRGIFLIISLSLGIETGRSRVSFCLAVISFIGGSGYGQQNPFFTLLVFLGGFYVGHNQATVYIVLLSWLVAYACHFHVKDVVLMTLAYWFGILSNVSNHVLFVVMFSYLGGKAVQYDKKTFFYVGLSFLMASRGRMSDNIPFFTEFDSVT